MTATPPPADTPEFHLRAYALTGDPAAAGSLFDATAPAIVRVALALTRDAASAEDALQETFLAALEHASSFEQGRPALPWLTGILRRKVGRQRRDAARTPDPARMRASPTPDEPPALAATAEERARVQVAIEALQEPYRAVALLRWRYGLEPAEIAHVRGDPPGTVRSLLHRAARRLEAALGALPAVLVACGGRGLDVVRTTIIERLPPVPVPVPVPGPTPRPVPPAAPAATAALLSGVMLMGTTQKVALAAAALLIVFVGGLGAWTVGRGDGAPQEPTATSATAVAADADPERTHVRIDVAAPETDSERTPSAVLTLPPSVDLDAADRDRDVHGRVTDAAGDPVPGASLTLLKYPWRRTSVLNHGAYGTSQTVAEALSAADGSFAFRLRRGALVDVRVSADGYVSQTLGEVQAGERLAIELMPERDGGIELSIIVLDPGGAVVPGASVRVFTLANQRDFRIDERATTDDDGRATFGTVPPGVTLHASVEADGLGSSGWVEFRYGARDQTISLPAGRTVVGTVTDARTVLPVAGALIGMNWVQNRAVRSGDDGVYELVGWTGRGTSEIAITADGFGRQSVEVGERDVVDFVLQPGDAAVGRLIGPGGSPVVGALVSAIASRRDGRNQTTSFAHDVSGDDGAFRLGSLRHDMSHTLVVTAEGVGRTLLDFDPHPGSAGVVDLGDVPVHAGFALEGVVRDADGLPVPHLDVSLSGANDDRARLTRRPSPESFYGTTESRRTDDLGRFRFPDLARGTYSVSARPRGAPQGSTSVRITNADVLDATISLARGRRVTVRAIDSDGNALPGVFIGALGGRGQIDGRTGDDGTCELTIQGGSLVQFYAFGGDELPADLVQPPTQQLATDATELTFRFLRGRMLQGRVLDARGEPIAEVQVEIRVDGELRTVVTSDADGRFEQKVGGDEPLDLVVKGVVHRQEGRRLTIEKLPWRGELRGVVPGGADVSIHCREIETGRSISVRVTDPLGNPLAGVRVWSFDGTPGTEAAVTGDDGLAEIHGLPAEECGIMAYPADPSNSRWIAPAARREVPDGQTIEMVFRRAAEITGTLLDRDDQPVVGATVSAKLPDGSLFNGTTETEGHFSIRVPADEPAFTLTALWASPTKGAASATRSGVSPNTDVRITETK